MKYKEKVLQKNSNSQNPDKFAEIYSVFARKVYFTALRITKNEQDASDIVQETMVVLYKNLNNIPNIHAMESFVYKTATNFSLMVLRKRRDYLVENDDFFETSNLEEEFIPEDYVENKETRNIIIDCIDALPDLQRATILLFYYDNLGINEIAKITDTSVATVKTRLFRGREKLKQVLENIPVKGALTTAMSTSALSRILTIEADAAYSSSISAITWKTICKDLSFSDKVIKTTSQVALNNSSNVSLLNNIVFSGSGIVGKAVGAAGLSKAITGILISGSIILGGIALTKILTVNNFNLVSPPNQLEDKTVQTHLDNPSGSNIVADNKIEGYTQQVVFSPQGQFVEVTLPTLSKDDVDVNISAALLPDNLIIPELNQTLINNSNLPTKTLVKKENMTPLRYKKGTTVDIQDIMEKAQVKIAPDAKIEISYAENIDNNKIGDYVVKVTANKGSASQQIVIIIEIVA